MHRHSRQSNRRLALALLLSVAAPSPALAQQGSTVTIERVADKQWRATYALSSPTVSLRFNRPAGFYRERVWRVVTPGYRLTRSGDLQFLTLDSAATARREIVIEFPEFHGPLEKEYELFQPFSDGAVAVYTGHFHVTRFGQSAADSAAVRTIRIVPRANEHTVAQGRVQKGVRTLLDTVQNGTYVYIGTAKPIETQDVVAIVDPGMPTWLTDLFNRNLPALFNEYRTRLGAALPVKPVVYFSFSETGRGRSSGGGTLTGLINMTLSGDGWRERTPDAAEQAFSLIAHESAHMWNGELVRNADDGAGSWMHEGSADFMANELLSRFGIIDSSRHRARREVALNNCAAEVPRGAVETALRRGRVQMVYDCGFVMSMWADAHARASGSKADLFGLWRHLIASTRGGAYTAGTFYAALEANGIPAATITRMRAFVSSSDSMAIAIAGLRDAGITVAAGVRTPPPSYHQNLARNVVVHLMQQACGRVSFYWGSPLRTAAVPSCAPFVNELTVYRINNFRMPEQGVELYDSVRSACASGGGVTLHGENGAVLVTVPCNRPLAERVPWYGLD